MHPLPSPFRPKMLTQQRSSSTRAKNIRGALVGPNRVRTIQHDDLTHADIAYAKLLKEQGRVCVRKSSVREDWTTYVSSSFGLDPASFRRSQAHRMWPFDVRLCCTSNHSLRAFQLGPPDVDWVNGLPMAGQLAHFCSFVDSLAWRFLFDCGRFCRPTNRRTREGLAAMALYRLAGVLHAPAEASEQSTKLSNRE